MAFGDPASFRALIAGGGIAAAEAALALRALAGERVEITLLAPQSELILRPWRIEEAFGGSAGPHITLAAIARDAEAELLEDAFGWLDAPRKIVHTASGARLGYDALLLAVGARPHPAFPHALTLDGSRMREQLTELLAEIDAGGVDSLALVVPAPMPWPIPMYEIALRAAVHARRTQRRLTTTLLTPEDAPLALFGREASAAVATLLAEEGVGIITGAACGVPRPGVVTIGPGSRTLAADRIVALPQLHGPAVPGVPGRGLDGFIAIDPFCRVRRLRDVYAAGDATGFPVKHGSIAAQQADVAARAIAARAGAPVDVMPLAPVIHAVLTGGGRALTLSARLTGGQGSWSSAHEQQDGALPLRIEAPYIAPYLEAQRTSETTR